MKSGLLSGIDGSADVAWCYISCAQTDPTTPSNRVVK